MGKYDTLKDELIVLVDEGRKLETGLSICSRSYNIQDATEEDKSVVEYFFDNYEKWYTKALFIIKVFIPDRYNDFSLLYKNDKRKEISWKTYTISDAIQLITSKDKSLHPYKALRRLSQQVSMLEVCLDKFESKIFDIQTILQADVFDSEIESARHLSKMGYLRAAGAICGVIIEKHLADVCRNHNIGLKKKNPSISDYNDSLKDIAYDTVEWRRIQRLGDLRNLCDHSKDREPLKEELDELISGTDRVIKTVF